ncbi:hypothetical protein BDZ89DRAFT_1134225 [Hymenopellis radicata]|nr:hypothetical protein BDZ89DRAFT_1134225 [Hymenopellis radicata]
MHYGSNHHSSNTDDASSFRATTMFGYPAFTSQPPTRKAHPVMATTAVPAASTTSTAAPTAAVSASKDTDDMGFRG